MPTRLMQRHRVPAPRRSMAGVSLVELMVAVTLGLLVLAGLASLFANSSATRNEIERSSRQIENGRFAIELLSDDLRLAGFYGELNVRSLGPAGALKDPCSSNPVDWAGSIPYHVLGYDNGVGVPPCVPADLKPGTDVLVVRRVSSCEAGVADCPPVSGALPYIQVARCASQTLLPANTYKLGRMGETIFDRMLQSCAAAPLAAMRQYFVRIYYISTDNGSGEIVPTLKRLDFDGQVFISTPLVEGIEELQIEYGIDWNGDGSPDGYNADPKTYAPGICGASCNEPLNWANVVTARLHVLARNIEPSVNFTDTKTYMLGHDAAGGEVTITRNDSYRRHAYTGLVRVVNAAQRRDTPL